MRGEVETSLTRLIRLFRDLRLQLCNVIRMISDLRLQLGILVGHLL